MMKLPRAPRRTPKAGARRHRTCPRAAGRKPGAADDGRRRPPRPRRPARMPLTPGRTDACARTPPWRPPPNRWRLSRRWMSSGRWMVSLSRRGELSSRWRPSRRWMPPRRTYLRRTGDGSGHGRRPTAGWSPLQRGRTRRQRRLHASRNRSWRRPPARPAGSGRISRGTRRPLLRRSTRDHDRRRPPARPPLRGGTCGISKSARWQWAPRRALALLDVPSTRPALAGSPRAHRRRCRRTRRQRPPPPRSRRRVGCGNKQAAPSSRWRWNKADGTRTPPDACPPARLRRPTLDRPTTAHRWRLTSAAACGRATPGPARLMLLLHLMRARRWCRVNTTALLLPRPPPAQHNDSAARTAAGDQRAAVLKAPVSLATPAAGQPLRATGHTPALTLTARTAGPRLSWTTGRPTPSAATPLVPTPAR